MTMVIEAEPAGEWWVRITPMFDADQTVYRGEGDNWQCWPYRWTPPLWEQFIRPLGVERGDVEK